MSAPARNGLLTFPKNSIFVVIKVNRPPIIPIKKHINAAIVLVALKKFNTGSCP